MAENELHSRLELTVVGVLSKNSGSTLDLLCFDRHEQGWKASAAELFSVKTGSTEEHRGKNLFARKWQTRTHRNHHGIIKTKTEKPRSHVLEKSLHREGFICRPKPPLHAHLPPTLKFYSVECRG